MCACVHVHKVLCFAVLALWISPVIWGEITIFMQASVFFFKVAFCTLKRAALKCREKFCVLVTYVFDVDLSVNSSSTYSTAEDGREKAKSPDVAQTSCRNPFCLFSQNSGVPNFGCTFEVGK